MEKTVEMTVSGSAVRGVTALPNLHIAIRDYDVDGIDRKDVTPKKDEKGDFH